MTTSGVERGTGEDDEAAPAGSPSRLLGLLVAGLVVLGVAAWIATGDRGRSDALSDVPYAGSLGVINDREVIERGVAEELLRPDLITVGEVRLGRHAMRCLATRSSGGDQAPPRLVAEVRFDGRDALAVVVGRTGTLTLDLVAVAGCDTLRSER